MYFYPGRCTEWNINLYKPLSITLKSTSPLSRISTALNLTMRFTALALATLTVLFSQVAASPCPTCPTPINQGQVCHCNATNVGVLLSECMPLTFLLTIVPSVNYLQPCPSGYRCCGPLVQGVGGTCFLGATGVCPL
ncbi:hypothetical protein P691DRAFT_400940 [Macrolepiota fuliginosa MF-IS2]|uniref:Uncharacterized protein n=1 Tax=Macrolepiota fuliginosa MF-IS2 TaxID=1400762 RepID=A0A9P5XGW0_9AGAR|nr:hypothetical protein P691DRAFT_400940 [Macrolepiota fuliginosa MF-IS2]